MRVTRTKSFLPDDKPVEEPKAEPKKESSAEPFGSDPRMTLMPVQTKRIAINGVVHAVIPPAPAMAKHTAST